MDFDMQAFVRVVDKGTFAAAAEDLQLTSSAMSKLVTRLEDRLGVKLLHRTTRRLALTPEGEVYLARAREIIEAILGAEAEVSSTAREPKGRLRINCTSGFAFHQLARVLPEFSNANPELRVELSVTDRVVDLLAENADVGLRSGEVSAQTLVVKRIARFQRRLYASPDYLNARGFPLSPLQLLSDHRCIVHGLQSPTTWPFDIDGVKREFNIPSNIAVDNAEAALWLAVAGGGVTRVADMMAADCVKQGLLVPVLHEFHFKEDVPFAAVYPHGRHRMPKVRTFLEYLSSRFMNEKW